jgi:hypothetical protein
MWMQLLGMDLQSCDVLESFGLDGLVGIPQLRSPCGREEAFWFTYWLRLQGLGLDQRTCNVWKSFGLGS